MSMKQEFWHFFFADWICLTSGGLMFYTTSMGDTGIFLPMYNNVFIKVKKIYIYLKTDSYIKGSYILSNGMHNVTYRGNYLDFMS